LPPHDDAGSAIEGIGTSKPTVHGVERLGGGRFTFAEDLFPIFVAMGVKAERSVMLWNKAYEGATGWTSELGKFGVHAFMADPHRIITFGGKPLAASVPGRGVIRNATPVQRAHPRFAESIRALGAHIE
jgi:UDP-N-acetylglucosamine 1-carboxyvinyltransferase